jgi:hypothetical protein
MGMVQAVAASCRHHWLLSEPRQGVIFGVCKHCRATRQYPARLEDTDRYYDYQDLSDGGGTVSLAIRDTSDDS